MKSHKSMHLEVWNDLDLPVSALQATAKEHFFVWHHKNRSSSYKVYSSWTQVSSLAEFLNDPRLYIIDSCPIGLQNEMITGQSLLRKFSEVEKDLGWTIRL